MIESALVLALNSLSGLIGCAVGGVSTEISLDSVCSFTSFSSSWQGWICTERTDKV